VILGCRREYENYLAVFVVFTTMSTLVMLMGLGGADVICRGDVIHLYPPVKRSRCRARMIAVLRLCSKNFT